MGCQRFNLGWPCARQTPSLLCYPSSSETVPLSQVAVHKLTENVAKSKVEGGQLGGERVFLGHCRWKFGQDRHPPGETGGPVWQPLSVLVGLWSSSSFSVTWALVFRSYGRAPKMIHLESNFVQFKEELLPKEGNKALLTFPFLHIYWTECCVSAPLPRPRDQALSECS